MITAEPSTDKFQAALSALWQDIHENNQVSQLFFYANATIVASYESYPEPLEEMINLADQYEIDLFVCSAAFQKRKYQLSSLGQQDFQFMGLGQYIAASTQSNKVRVF